jgi:hypothetical protein
MGNKVNLGSHVLSSMYDRRRKSAVESGQPEYILICEVQNSWLEGSLRRTVIVHTIASFGYVATDYRVSGGLLP